MSLIICPLCTEDEEVPVVRLVDDGRKLVDCRRFDREWDHLRYTTEMAGKHEIVRSVYGLEIPDPERVTWVLDRLIQWRNDELRVLVGEGFVDQQHAATLLSCSMHEPGGLE